MARSKVPRNHPTGGSLLGRLRSSLSCEWLIQLRWWLIAVEIVALLLVDLLSAIRLPYLPLGFLLTGAIATNLFLVSYKHRSVAHQHHLVGTFLAIDALFFAGLLYWTGGPFNPFSALLLLYIAVGAAVLGSGWTWILALVASGAYAFLFYDHVPLEGLSGSHADHMNFHLYGMWIAFALVAGFISYFLNRIMSEITEQENQIQRLQLARLHQERLTALTTLAAGAAHELATPLGTIGIAAGELAQRAKSENLPERIVRDSLLIDQEVKRCRSIIDRMGNQTDEMFKDTEVVFSLAGVLDELSTQFNRKKPNCLKVEGPEVDLELRASRGALLQSLSSLAQNALDASGETVPVLVRCHREEESLCFEVVDRGSGMSEEVARRAVEPFFTTKEAGRGMGLGLFLVGLYTERIGGSLSIRSMLGRGTTVEMRIPIDRKETAYAAA